MLGDWLRKQIVKLTIGPCLHITKRPAITRHHSAKPPTPTWVCAQCEQTGTVSVEEFYAMFGRMPW